MNAKPDIIFFMVDELSAKWFEAAIDGASELPNFNWLLEHGCYFRNTFTSNPVCCPTRATLATGLTTRGHGVLENGYQLDPTLPTFMRTLQRNGWRTGAFGKAHFQPHFRGLYPDYRIYGFDETHITEDSRGGEWLDWVEEQFPEHFDSVLATIWATQIPEFEHYGQKKINLQERIEKIRSEFRWETEDHPKNTSLAAVLPFPEEACQTNWITMHALDFIRRVPQRQPLYAHISYVQPHGPFHTFAEYMDKVDSSKIPELVPAEWTQDAHAPLELKRRKPFGPQTHDVEYCRTCYFADLAHLDSQLGEVLSALRSRGRLADTYIIFLSDHGDMLFDHGLLGKEEKHYDACIRVPLIISGPGMQEGAKLDHFVQLEDICPTILDLAGQNLPLMPKMGPYLHAEQQEIPVHSGYSLRGMCTGGKARSERNCIYTESYNTIDSAHPGQWARTIRTRKYRYTFYPDGYGEQLFDMENDPDEQSNLVADPNFQHIRAELRDRLLELIIMQDYPKTRRELFALGVH